MENVRFKNVATKDLVRLAVWRKRGSVSPESLCEFASFVLVRALVKAPPVAKPLGRCVPVPLRNSADFTQSKF